MNENEYYKLTAGDIISLYGKRYLIKSVKLGDCMEHILTLDDDTIIYYPDSTYAKRMVSIPAGWTDELLYEHYMDQLSKNGTTTIDVAYFLAYHSNRTYRKPMFIYQIKIGYSNEPVYTVTSNYLEEYITKFDTINECHQVFQNKKYSVYCASFNTSDDKPGVCILRWDKYMRYGITKTYANITKSSMKRISHLKRSIEHDKRLTDILDYRYFINCYLYSADLSVEIEFGRLTQ